MWRFLCRFAGPSAAGVALLVLGLLCAGCSVTRDHITVDYAMMSGVTKLQGAESVGVKVKVVDLRPNREEVGRKQWEESPQYDLGGAILAQADLAGLITTAIESELAQRGFQKEEGSVMALVQLRKFYNVFKGFPEQAVAEVVLTVEVLRPDGQPIFSKTITGQGVQALDVAQWDLTGKVRSGENAKLALESALTDAMRRLFNQTYFIATIMRAAELQRGK